MRRGGQYPTFEVVGDYAYSNADEAIEMFESYGRVYYDSQKYEMRLFYARNADGTFAANSIGSTKPRQNGKSFGARDYALDSACMDGKRVLYSAHHGRTSRAMFKEMCDFIEAHEDFKNELDYIYKAGGYEGIYFKNGGCIEFQTRTNSGGRGGTYDIVIVDEAQEMTTAQQEALIPVVSAAQELEGGSGTQVIYLGTVPSPECPGTVFKDMHDRAHSGDTKMWWLEWGAQGGKLSDIDLDDKDLWYAVNPAMGRRMSEAAVQNERDTMSPDGFARERLGWWPRQSAGAVISSDKWDACRADHAGDGIDSYGIKFSADGSRVCLSVCRNSDEPWVELLFDESVAKGIGWLVDWVVERKGKVASVVIDGRSGSTALAQKLESSMPHGVVKIPRTVDVIAANAGLLSAVNEGKLRHGGQSQLAASATLTTKRKIGGDGGWGFGDTPAACAAPIESAALALWGASNTKRKPGRKQRVV